MGQPDQWNHKVFGVKEQDINGLALEIFRFQHENNPVYRAYTDALNLNPASVTTLKQIPFLPIRFFKSHAVKTGAFEPAIVFESSGTTGMTTSRHLVKDLSLYEGSFTGGFNKFYGSVKDWCIIGLLPSYLERGNSSLVYMVDKLIHASGHPESGFYLDEYAKLSGLLKKLEDRQQKTLLIGVTFALLDLAEQFPQDLNYTIIMETGGMKGRREEIIRASLHEILQGSFGTSNIHSEYGMTELLSQAYSKQSGLFHCPPWMKILVRDEEDPFSVQDKGPGAINVIDLANIHSCSFIATDDAGRLNEDGSFEILGRLDGSDLRGCSLLTV